MNELELKHLDLDELSRKARLSPRLRQHLNIHTNHNELCQRLFNGIEPDSYIRPHRHSIDGKKELLLAIRGSFSLFIFDNSGHIDQIINFGADSNLDPCLGAEVSPASWHTVLSKSPGSVLLEIKEGPFNPNHAKELAPWAPEEGTPESKRYLNQLILNSSAIP